jgi:hypothetical protein
LVLVSRFEFTHISGQKGLLSSLDKLSIRIIAYLDAPRGSTTSHSTKPKGLVPYLFYPRNIIQRGRRNITPFLVFPITIPKK